MAKVKLQKEIIEDIVEIVAEELNIVEMGIDEKEVITKLVALSIALYLNMLNPEFNAKGEIQ